MATPCKIRYMKAVVKLGDVYISSTPKRLLQRDIPTSTIHLKDMAVFCFFFFWPDAFFPCLGDKNQGLALCWNNIHTISMRLCPFSLHSYVHTSSIAVPSGDPPDAQLPFEFLSFLASYLSAASTHPNTKGLMWLLAEVMEGGPLIRTGPEADPSFFPAVAQDTFIILVHLFYIIFFFHQNSLQTIFPSLSKSFFGRKSCILKRDCLVEIYSAHPCLAPAVPLCTNKVKEGEFLLS